MTFVEMEEEVYIMTNRRALVAETRQSLISAARHYHAAENWGNDSVEATVAISPEAYAFVLDKDTEFPLLRVFNWIRKWDASGVDPFTGLASGAAGLYFINKDAGTLTDGYGLEIANVYYELGTNVRFISNTSMATIRVSYQVWPTLYPYTNFNSWFMTKFPELLIVNAALRIAIANSDSSKIKSYSALDMQNHIDALASFMTLASK